MGKSTGNPAGRRRGYNGTQEERFWRKVDQTDSCWLWTKNTTPEGYGAFWCDEQRTVLAHRLAYEMLIGPIPDGLVLDHLCHVRNCVNPEHLEPVTQRENVMRSTAVSAINARKAACDHGHDLAGDNLYLTPDGRRQCRTCRAEASRIYQAKRKARRAA